MTLGNGSNLCDFSCDDIIFKNGLSEKILGLTSLKYVKLQIKNSVLYSEYQLI